MPTAKTITENLLYTSLGVLYYVLVLVCLALVISGLISWLRERKWPETDDKQEPSEPIEWIID